MTHVWEPISSRINSLIKNVEFKYGLISDLEKFYEPDIPVFIAYDMLTKIKIFYTCNL